MIILKKRDFFEENVKGAEYSFGQEMSLGINAENLHAKEYGFIGNPGFDKKYTVDEMREKFLSIF